MAGIVASALLAHRRLHVGSLLQTRRAILRPHGQSPEHADIGAARIARRDKADRRAQRTEHDADSLAPYLACRATAQADPEHEASATGHGAPRSAGRSHARFPGG